VRLLDAVTTGRRLRGGELYYTDPGENPALRRASLGGGEPVLVTRIEGSDF
jgi:hypothetical protein